MTFECKRCGKCCGIVPFTKPEYEKIRKFAKEHHIGFVKQNMLGKTVYFGKKVYKKFQEAMIACQKEGRLIDNQIDDISCPFLEYDESGKSRCMIYENRPEICRLFGKGGHKFLVCPNNPQVEIVDNETGDCRC